MNKDTTYILDASIKDAITACNMTSTNYCYDIGCKIRNLDSNSFVIKAADTTAGKTRLYVSNSKANIDKMRSSTDKQWIEVIMQDGEIASCIYFNRCDKSRNGYRVSICNRICNFGTSDFSPYEKFMTQDNNVYTITTNKDYGETDQQGLEKRSIYNTQVLGKKEISIIHFEGTVAFAKLLLFSGVSKLNIYLSDKNILPTLKLELEDLCKNSPYSSEIVLICGANDGWKFNPNSLVIMKKDKEASIPHLDRHMQTITYSTAKTKRQQYVWIGLNHNALEHSENIKIPKYAINYVYGLIAELAINWIVEPLAKKARKIFSIDATDLNTTTKWL